MGNRWEPVKCPCGSPHCNDYGTSVGKFNQGTGFDEATAQKICDLMNAEEAPRRRVRKIKGYKFEGEELGRFTKRDGVTRFVNVENDDGWVMHFRETDLEEIVR